MSRYEGFIGPWYSLLGRAADSQRAVNLYPMVVESGNGKNNTVLRGRAGLTTFATLPTTPVRGLLSAGSPLSGTPKLFAVGGSKLYELDSTGATTLRGDVGNDASNSPAQIFLNGTDLLVVSAGQSYLDDGGGVSALQSDGVTAMPTAVTGAFIDGYYIVNQPTSRDVLISALFDGGTWDALDVQQKVSYPDHVAAVLAVGRDLWVFGESRSEIWEHTGAAAFPFERAHVIESGLAARWSAVSLMGRAAWLGADTRGRLVAWWSQGMTPQRVSNFAIEEEWSAGYTVSDAISYTFNDNGHHFWVITFPTSNATWVFDATTGWWHQWMHSTGGKHRGRCHCFAFDKHLVGDHTSGKIYRMSETLSNDDGTAILRIRQAPHVADSEFREFYDELTLDLVTDSSVNPTVNMTYSDSNGQTWVTDRPATGAASGFTHRRTWRRMGSSRDRIYSVSTSVDSNLTLIDAFLKLGKGND